MEGTPATPPKTPNPLTSSRVILHSFPSEQAGRLDRQNQCHRRVERKIGNLRKQGLAEIIGQANQQRTDRGAAEAAHAANDDHGESQRQDLKVKPGINTQETAANDPPQNRKEGAEGQY